MNGLIVDIVHDAQVVIGCGIGSGNDIMNNILRDLLCGGESVEVILGV